MTEDNCERASTRASTDQDLINAGNWELHPVGSAERFAIVLSMSDGLSSQERSVFPQYYDADPDFVARARHIWKEGTQLTGKEIETYLYSQNGKLDLGYSWDTGTPESVGLRPGSSTDRFHHKKTFVSGGRVIGLAHTHPESNELEEVLSRKFSALKGDMERFSYGDF